MKVKKTISTVIAAALILTSPGLGAWEASARIIQVPVQRTNVVIAGVVPVHPARQVLSSGSPSVNPLSIGSLLTVPYKAPSPDTLPTTQEAPIRTFH